MQMEAMELIKKARAGDRAARNLMVEENVGLVWNIVRRFGGRGYDSEDIFQIGCIGLIKAIDNFDLRYDVKFSTYAVPMITGEIKRFLRDDGMIRVSRSLKENGWKIKRATESLNQELGRSATIDEIAAATELEPGEIVMALEANSEVDSLYRTVYQSDGKEISMVEQIASPLDRGEGYKIDREKDELVDHLLVNQLLNGLGEMERKLIEYRYFGEMTQTEVAKRLGISQVQVSRLEKKILQNMRKDALCQ